VLALAGDSFGIGWSRRSGPYQLDVSPCRRYEYLKVVAIDRHDLVAIRGKKRQRRVYDVGSASHAQEFACGAAEVLVERLHIGPRQRRPEPGLTGPAAPDLADDAGVRHR
jgi:hypothetical protein